MDFFTKILASPSLVWVLTAMGFYLVNIFLGLFIAFQKNTVDTRKIHKYLFYSITFCLVYFLIMNQTHHENTLIDYAVVLYMVALVPFSKRWDVLAHALVAVIGLILMPLLIVLQI
ncbi:MAG TPA: hypothetical protein HPP54_04795 [Nitrospinae bacterium]|jgi:hypothetical protein|nr:hypothetical protein [Nitrospinota bacterium]